MFGFFVEQTLAHDPSKVHIVPSSARITLAAHAATAAASFGLDFALHDFGARRGLQHPFRFTPVRRLSADDRRVEVIHGRVPCNIVVSSAAGGR